MIDPRRSVPILAMLILALAACGGSGTSGSTAASSAAAAPAASAVAPDASAGAVGGAPSVEPSAAPPDTVPASQPATEGGGSGGDVCSLVTVDELADIFDVASVTTTVFAGPPDNCIVDSDAGDGLAAWSLTTVQADAIFFAMTSDPSTIDVPGIGDRAAIVQNTGLMVQKGSNLLVISVAAGANLSEEEGVEAAKQIGTIAAGRL